MIDCVVDLLIKARIMGDPTIKISSSVSVLSLLQYSPTGGTPAVVPADKRGFIGKGNPSEAQLAYPPNVSEAISIIDQVTEMLLDLPSKIFHYSSGKSQALLEKRLNKNMNSILEILPQYIGQLEASLRTKGIDDYTAKIISEIDTLNTKLLDLFLKIANNQFYELRTKVTLISSNLSIEANNLSNQMTESAKAEMERRFLKTRFK